MPISVLELKGALSAQITNEMKTNEALAPFEAEYTRLYESLYTAHRNEKELSEQCLSLRVNFE